MIVTGIITIIYFTLVVPPFLLGAFDLPLTTASLLVIFPLLILCLFGLRPAKISSNPAENPPPRGLAMLENLVIGLASIIPFLFYLQKSAGFSFLPVGITVDAVHHYALADYLGVHRALPYAATPEERAQLVEMVGYPPAYHLVAMWVQRLSGAELAQVIYPVAAALLATVSAALAGMVTLVLKAGWHRPVLALGAALLSVVAVEILPLTILYFDFYGQVAGLASLALGWYFTVRYWRYGQGSALLGSAMAGAVLGLAYTHWLPMYLFPVLLALFLKVVQRQFTFTLVAGGTLALALPVFVTAIFLIKRGNAAPVWGGGAGGNVAISSEGVIWILLAAGLAALLLLVPVTLKYARRGDTLANPNPQPTWIGSAVNRLAMWQLVGLIWVGLASWLLWEWHNRLQVALVLSSDSGADKLYSLNDWTTGLAILALLGAGLGVFSTANSRFFSGAIGGAVTLEIAGYLLVEPGGVSANAYQMSKFYSVVLGLALPVLATLPMEKLLYDLPVWLWRKFKPSSSNLQLIGRVTGGAMAAVACLVLVAGSITLLPDTYQPERQTPLVEPNLIAVARQYRATNGTLGTVELAVRQGVPAYFTQVGLLSQPRDNRASNYLFGEQFRFEQWLFDPTARPYLLTDSFDQISQLYPTDPRYRLLYTQGKAALLVRSEQYLGNLVQRGTFFLDYQGIISVDTLTARIQLSGIPRLLNSIEVGVAVGELAPGTAPLLEKPLYRRLLSYRATEEDYATLRGFLNLKTGRNLSSGEVAGKTLPTEDFKLPPGKYSLWVQITKEGKVVAQRKAQDFELLTNREITPLAPLTTTEPASLVRSGQILLEQPVTSSERLTPANTFFNKDDETRLIEITGWQLDRPAYQPGETARLRASFLPAINLNLPYVMFVQLLDKGGAVVAQSDLEPANGLYPTWLWEKERPVYIEQNLKLPTTLPAGNYSLQLGFYSNPGQVRLQTWFYEPYVNRIWENHFLVKDVLRLAP